ncbi:hypothetical protein JCM18899A_21510 [Nocardioides sp. AN3]
MRDLTHDDRSALHRLLGGPETAWLVERVRARILDAAGQRLTGVVVLKQPTPAQRSAIVSLVGRPRRSGATLRVDLADVEEMLRRGPWAAGLADAVEALTGPVADAAAERARDVAAWREAYAGLGTPLERFSHLPSWWESWCERGGLKRMARAEATRTGIEFGPAVGADLVAQAAAVLEALPASGEPLAVLARRVTGDAHGLDEGRPLGRLVQAIVAAVFADEDLDLAESATAGRGRSARDTWAAAGVVLSNVASTVLCLGVSGERSDMERAHSMRAGATAAVLDATRAARMPVVLTLDQVRAGGVRSLPADASVYVCENPSVIEVVSARWSSANPGPADGHGPVLVCTSGQPSAAVVELLAALTRGGAACRYHGDFDWAGLRIARALSSRVPWTPWRFSSEDYEKAVEQMRTGSLALVGKPSESPWDPELALSMARHGLAVEEEAVARMLADDVVFGVRH